MICLMSKIADKVVLPVVQSNDFTVPVLIFQSILECTISLQVTLFVLQGSIEEARRLLAANSNRSSAFLLMDQMLKTMPVFTVSSSHSLHCLQCIYVNPLLDVDSCCTSEMTHQCMALFCGVGLPRALSGRVWNEVETLARRVQSETENWRLCVQ